MQGPGDPSGALLEALTSLLEGRGMVTGFIVVAEFVDDDGDIRLWADTMADQRSHRSMGLLEWGLTVERARTTKVFLEDEND